MIRDGRREDDQILPLSLTMERTFMSSGERLSLRAGDAAKDPLVIGFDGTAAELSDTTFSFDLDGKRRGGGYPFFVGTGSGFLVLDKNGDGVTVNDGSELFRARRGRRLCGAGGPRRGRQRLDR
ncbi:MAG: hypothetical protein MZW92_06645 [Comamonadaceae bacterium]|nr:hypothetical protein [Comamonadaceae bacterium]